MILQRAFSQESAFVQSTYLTFGKVWSLAKNEKSVIIPCILSGGSSELTFSDCETQKASADKLYSKELLAYFSQGNSIESVTHVSIPIILNRPNFPDTYQMCVKYKKVLNHNSKHSVHQNVNIQEKSYKCNELDKMIHEFSHCTLYNKSDTAENCNKYRSSNHRDASIKHLNRKTV